MKIISVLSSFKGFQTCVIMVNKHVKISVCSHSTVSQLCTANQIAVLVLLQNYSAVDMNISHYPSTLARTLITQPLNKVKGSGLGCDNAFGLLMCSEEANMLQREGFHSIGEELRLVWPKENVSLPNHRNISKNGIAHFSCGLFSVHFSLPK